MYIPPPHWRPRLWSVSQPSVILSLDATPLQGQPFIRRRLHIKRLLVLAAVTLKTVTQSIHSCCAVSQACQILQGGSLSRSPNLHSIISTVSYNMVQAPLCQQARARFEACPDRLGAFPSPQSMLHPRHLRHQFPRRRPRVSYRPLLIIHPAHGPSSCFEEILYR